MRLKFLHASMYAIISFHIQTAFKVCQERFRLHLIASLDYVLRTLGASRILDSSIGISSKALARTSSSMALSVCSGFQDLVHWLGVFLKIFFIFTPDPWGNDPI